MTRVAIVGAGISGLATAFRLRQRLPDLELTVLEASSRPGGNIGTVRHDGFQLDTGPNGFLDNKQFTLNLCRDLGLSDELIPASEASRRHRYLFWNGRLTALPGGPAGLLTTRLLRWHGKIALLREPFRSRASGDKDESIAEFFRRRIGPEATKVFVDALVTGIHGGDPEQLSMRAAFPRVWQMEQEAGSILQGFRRAARERKREARARGERKTPPQRMWSFQQGMGQLPEALAKKLGPALQLNAGVERLEHDAAGYRLLLSDGRHVGAQAVLLTCPSWRQAEILESFDCELAHELAGIAYTPIVVVALGYRSQDVPHVPHGFGFIAPQNQKRDLLGVQWCSSIFPDRAPPGYVLWRALCGGWNRRDIIDWSDERVSQAVSQELRRALGVQAKPAFQQIVRWPRAIPQYFVGHNDRVSRIEALASRHEGLFLSGNFLHGIAINDCTEQAEVVAERMARSFATGFDAR